MGDLDIPTIPMSPSSIVLPAVARMEVQNKFLEKFFSTQKTDALRDKIMQFSQQADESFSEAWEQFNNISIQCPHHGLPILVLMRIFYKALTISQQVDAITSKLDALLAMIGRVPTQEICSICAILGHATISCPHGVNFLEVLQEQANMVNTYRRPGND
ncbi:hypothetical protein L3X38_002595 [Prunus dulcis]|uniref:Retrotransposon gag domain-containing protein n=1 Tax=Prunus dulcis TaxID=3755 RepID=A0AAD4WUT8_PRUDU|nr:hypothetical protein L3X38_002595 [Prunus dulcis]